MFNILLPKKRTTVLHALLEHLKVPYTDIHLSSIIDHHPHANNMLGVSDILHKYNIESIGLKIDKTDIHKLEPPFLVQMKLENYSFHLVTDIRNDSVSVVTQEGKKESFTRKQFENKWTGVLLLPDPSEQSGEEDYNVNRRKQLLSSAKLPFTLFFLIAFLTGTMLHNQDSIPSNYLSATLLLMFLSAGTFISTLLLMQSIKKDNPFISRICDLAKTNGNCNDVLESSAAKIGGIISWSAIGFVFFGGSLLSYTLIPGSTPILFYLNTLALPYTAWSIYYQWKVVKKWCILCISIQIVLWICFALHMISYSAYNVFQPATFTYLGILCCFLFPMIAVWTITPLARGTNLLLPAVQELNSLKSNETIFRSLLNSQNKVEFWGHADDIKFGNPEAAFTLTLVTNPYCGPCSIAHKQIISLLAQYREFMQVRTIYAVGEGNEKRNNAIKNLIAAYTQHEPEQAEEIYDQWYRADMKNIETWKTRHPVVIDEKVMNIFNAHQEWCDYADIIATPAIFINGYELPSWYKIEDLKYFVRL